MPNKCECGKTWLWDWTRLSFVDENGKPYDSTALVNDTINIMEVFQCECGKVTAVYAYGPNLVYDVFKSENVDWEKEENIWQPNE